MRQEIQVAKGMDVVDRLDQTPFVAPSPYTPHDLKLLTNITNSTRDLPSGFPRSDSFVIACGTDGKVDDSSIKPVGRKIVDEKDISNSQREEMTRDIERLIKLGQAVATSNNSPESMKAFNVAANEINKVPYAVKLHNVYDGIRCGGSLTFFPPKDSDINYELQDDGSVTIKGLHDGDPSRPKDVDLKDILEKLKQVQQL